MKCSCFILGMLICTQSFAMETYELRNYQLTSAESAEQFDVWMETSGLTVLKDAGAAQVGVFKPKPEEEENDYSRFVLMRFDDLSDLQANRRAPVLASHSNEQAEAFLSGSKEDPAYARVDSSLLTAFPGFKHLVDPEGSGSDERFFELRIYESSSERLAALKVDMFCGGGEIEIFHEVGLTPVFFGSARIAGNFPQLTYMLVHENQEAADVAWQAFRKSEKWNVLRNLPKYEGTVSHILKYFIVALPYSEIR